MTNLARCSARLGLQLGPVNLSLKPTLSVSSWFYDLQVPAVLHCITHDRQTHSLSSHRSAIKTVADRCFRDDTPWNHVWFSYCEFFESLAGLRGSRTSFRHACSYSCFHGFANGWRPGVLCHSETRNLLRDVYPRGTLLLQQGEVFPKGRQNIMNDLWLGDDLMAQSITLREPHVIFP